MGPAPQLSTYETMAQQQYAGQQAADQTQATAQHQENLNTLNTELQGVGTQYNLQEQQLKSTVQQEAGQISQMYTTHLLGNFSGLQGNDMGQMFSKANLQEQSIESQRTNAINAINTNIANENISYNANESAITSKYQSLEASAAQSMYSGAVSAYNTAAYQQAQLAIRQEEANTTASYDAARIGIESSNAENSAQNNYLKGFQATAKKGGAGFAYKGPNGEALSLGQYASALGQGDAGNTLAVITNQLQQSGTSADQHALQFIGYLQKRGLNDQQVIQQLGAHARNNPGWDWAVDFKGL